MNSDIFQTESDMSFMLDHDEICIMQANQLLSMGCLEYETAAYGSAYMVNDEIYYYISSREERMKKFCQDACLSNRYHTPIRYFCKRYDLMEESEEEINLRFRLEVAQKLYDSYPKILFEATEELSGEVCANKGFPLVQALASALENNFDINELRIFANLLEMLLQGRQINREGYLVMRQWLEQEYEKNAEESIPYGTYKRQYAGFVYESEKGTRGYFMDALPYLAEEKQTEMIQQGYIVTPILNIRYYFDSFVNPQKNRSMFKEEMAKYLDKNYVTLMKLFRQLPSTVDQTRYHELAAEIAAAGKKEAIEAFRYYGYLCNVI